MARYRNRTTDRLSDSGLRGEAVERWSSPIGGLIENLVPYQALFARLRKSSTVCRSISYSVLNPGLPFDVPIPLFLLCLLMDALP